MTLQELRSYTCKELSELARKHKITGYSSMRKDELVQELRKVARRASRRAASGRSRAKKNGASKQNGSRTSISQRNGRDRKRSGNDSIRASVVDPHWLEVQWETSQTMRSRAQIALGTDWHTARLVIRVIDATTDDVAGGSDVRLQDVVVRKDARNWFVRVDDPRRTYRLQLGYRGAEGRFFALARSRAIRPSRAQKPAAAGNGRGSYSRPKDASNNAGRFLVGYPGEVDHSETEFRFSLGADLVIKGEVDPDAALTVLGKNVERDDNGMFTLHVGLESGRQVIPAVAVTPNGRTQRTIVLAVECNAKELEPQNFEDET